ncbi:MAG TPA: VOC family protein [candidate division Zixibacteria bacterium]|nr:VOC family protein [candidate division Zixibacteria bacterium]
MSETPQTGAIGWIDLTVPNADSVRDFYHAVTGWRPEPVAMGEYNDYIMTSAATGEPIAGVCHAHGGNRDLPAVWLIYIVVESLPASIAACEANGGEVIAQPRAAGGGQFCLIRDPAGAVAALYCAGKDPV